MPGTSSTLQTAASGAEHFEQVKRRLNQAAAAAYAAEDDAPLDTLRDGGVARRGAPGGFSPLYGFVKGTFRAPPAAEQELYQAILQYYRTHSKDAITAAMVWRQVERLDLTDLAPDMWFVAWRLDTCELVEFRLDDASHWEPGTRELTICSGRSRVCFRHPTSVVAYARAADGSYAAWELAGQVLGPGHGGASGC